MALRPAEGSVFPELVLLVDRDGAARRSYTETLASFGFRLETASNLQEAFDKSIAFSPDVIASIHDASGFDGVALGRLLKRDPRTRDIPFILVGRLDESATSSPDRSLIDSMLAAPCLPETLGAEIRRLIVLGRETRLRVLGVQFGTTRARTVPLNGRAAPADRSSERVNAIRERVSSRFRAFLKVGAARCPSCGLTLSASLSASSAACPHCGGNIEHRR